MDEAWIRNLVCEAMRMLYVKGLITPLAGNISVRLSDERIIVTPSRFPKFVLRPEHLSVVDIHGNHVEGPRPSSEIRMHLEIYRRVPDARAVVHIHGLYAPILAHLVEPIVTMELHALGLDRDSICVAPPLEPGSIELAQTVASYASRGCRIVVLQLHGIVAYGRDLVEALELAELGDLVYRYAYVYHSCLRNR